MRCLKFIIQHLNLFLNIATFYFGKLLSMTYYILANPFSGNGQGKRVTKALIPYLAQQGISYELFETQHAFDEARLIKVIMTQKTPLDRVLIIGGDGTLSLALNALTPEQPFSYIPAGSGNDFARAFGIPLNQPLKAFKKLHQANPQTIHVLKYDSQEMSGIAVNNIGIGLDAAIVAATNKGEVKQLLNKIKLGRLAYLLNALAVLFSKRPFPITVNHTEFTQAFLFTMTKHPFFGGGIPLAPKGSLLESDIHLVELDHFNLIGIVALIPKVFKGKHFTNRHVHYQIGKTYTLSTTSEQPMQIDGETFVIKANKPLYVTTEERLIMN